MVDKRTTLEKLRALAADTRGNPRIRELAQKKLEEWMQNSELAIDPTPEEAWRRYSIEYECVIKVKVGNITLPKRIKPESICNRRQCAEIFKHCTDWPSILHAMHQCVGCIGNQTPFSRGWTEETMRRAWEQEVAP